jgi:cobalt-zinc-cadmium resistance protein CzcA
MIDSMAAKLATIPGLPSNFSQVIEDNASRNPCPAPRRAGGQVFGPNLQVLEAKGQEIATVLNHIQGSADVAALPVGGQSEVDIRLQRQALARYGILVTDVNTMIQTALGGTAVNVYYDGERRYDVTLRFGPSTATRWTTSPTCR